MAHDSVEPGASSLNGTLVAGKYQIHGAVASGGMGTVYRARHLQLDRDVAIKLMHQRHFDNREYMARFRLEAQKAAGLEHPGIVEVRDFGEDAALGPYLEMELLTGFSLRELLQAVGPLPIEVVVHCIAECLDALHYAHGKGILHRDLKPANLFVARVGDSFQTKILDFGLAKAILGDSSATGQETLTKTGVVLGTLTYMSPEHFADFKSVDQRTDLYSLAASAYELLTGRPVVSGTSFIECVDKVSRGLHRQHPAQLRPAISAALDAVIARALRLDPRERFEDAAAMRTALLACERDPGEALLTLQRLVVEEDALARPRYRPTAGQAGEDALGFQMDAHDDEPTLLGQPVFDDEDAPTMVASSALLAEPETVHVSDSIRPSAPAVVVSAEAPSTPRPLEAPPTQALLTEPGRPIRRRRIPSTLWGAPIWFWAAALGLFIVLVAIVLARRPSAPPPALEGVSASPAPAPAPAPAAASAALATNPGAASALAGDTAPGAAGEAGAMELEAAPSEDEAPPPETEAAAQARRPRGTRGATEPEAEASSGATTLDVNTIPSARIFLDGQDTGRRTPARGIPITPGRHVVELRVGTRSHRYAVVASPGDAVRLFRVLPNE